MYKTIRLKYGCSIVLEKSLISNNAHLRTVTNTGYAQVLISEEEIDKLITLLVSFRQGQILKRRKEMACTKKKTKKGKKTK